MTDLQDLAAQLETAADAIQVTPRCANGCGTTLTAEQAKNRYAMCPQCARITKDGYRGCADCGREWTAAREAHCAVCHRHFSSDSAFDMHVVAPPPFGPRPFETCRVPPRLIQVESQHGPMWAWPGGRPSKINRSMS